MSVFRKVIHRMMLARRNRIEGAVHSVIEGLMIDDVEHALLYASFVTGAVVEEYTIAPHLYRGMRGTLRWVVEFLHRPDDMARFAEVLDERLRCLDSDYDVARRSVISPLIVDEVPRCPIYMWQQRMQQSTVPRVMSERQVVQALLEIAQEGGVGLSCKRNK